MTQWLCGPGLLGLCSYFLGLPLPRAVGILGARCSRAWVLPSLLCGGVRLGGSRIVLSPVKV